jgi:hypothetical protein
LIADPVAQQARKTVEKSLLFLERDVAKWRKEHDCATCHHGALTVWAFTEARRQGFAIGATAFDDVVGWTKSRFVPPPDQPLDLRPGYRIPSLASAFLALSARSDRHLISEGEMDRIAHHITVRQEADGAWPTPPPKNGPPPVFESREIMAIWYYLALETTALGSSKEAAASRNAREKAASWLSTVERSDTTQALTLRLFLDVRAGKPPDKLRPGIEGLLVRRSADGGWGQLKGGRSDAYATGQALYVLNLAGVQSGRVEIQRAVSFLVASQREDGSWPMASRAQPGEKPYTNPIPITYFGSAWATLGLVRSLPR